VVTAVFISCSCMQQGESYITYPTCYFRSLMQVEGRLASVNDRIQVQACCTLTCVRNCKTPAHLVHLGTLSQPIPPVLGG